GSEGLLVETEYKLGLKELAVKHLAPHLTNVRDEALQGALTPVFAKQAGTSAAWWKYLRTQHAKEAPAATLQRLLNLLEAKLPATELSALLAEAEQGARKLSGSGLAERMHLLAETCLLTGREDQARTFLQKWADAAGTAEALLRLGHAHAGKNQWAQAA